MGNRQKAARRKRNKQARKDALKQEVEDRRRHLSDPMRNAMGGASLDALKGLSSPQPSADSPPVEVKRKPASERPAPGRPSEPPSDYQKATPKLMGVPVTVQAPTNVVRMSEEDKAKAQAKAQKSRRQEADKKARQGERIDAPAKKKKTSIPSKGEDCTPYERQKVRRLAREAAEQEAINRSEACKWEWSRRNGQGIRVKCTQDHPDAERHIAKDPTPTGDAIARHRAKTETPQTTPKETKKMGRPRKPTIDPDFDVLPPEAVPDLKDTVEVTVRLDSEDYDTLCARTRALLMLRRRSPTDEQIEEVLEELVHRSMEKQREAWATMARSSGKAAE